MTPTTDNRHDITPPTCGDCLYLVTDDGAPFYCVMRDLYTFRETTDSVCDEYRPLKRAIYGSDDNKQST